jgi:hypothetical protein
MDVLGTPFLWSAQWPLHHDKGGCFHRREIPKMSAWAVDWGTCPQMTFWDTPLLKASYIWATSHACNYNKMSYRQGHTQSKPNSITSSVNHKRDTPCKPPFTASSAPASTVNGNTNGNHALSFCAQVHFHQWECIPLSFFLFYCFAG